MRFAPVSALSAAMSSIFSSVVRGSPPLGKRPKRVPPVPTAHDGAATEKRGDLVDDRLGVDVPAGEVFGALVEVALVARRAGSASISAIASA